MRTNFVNVCANGNYYNFLTSEFLEQSVFAEKTYKIFYILNFVLLIDLSSRDSRWWKDFTITRHIFLRVCIIIHYIFHYYLYWRMLIDIFWFTNLSTLVNSFLHNFTIRTILLKKKKMTNNEFKTVNSIVCLNICLYIYVEYEVDTTKYKLNKLSDNGLSLLVENES